MNPRATGAPCEGARPIDGDLRFSTWERTRAVRTEVCFDVYVPGVTDRDDVDVTRWLEAAARVRYAPTRPFVQAPATFVGRAGNNARFMIDLRALDPFPPYACHLVATTRRDQPGNDLLQATMELVPVVNGLELRGADGGPLRVLFEDAPTGPFRDPACLVTPRGLRGGPGARARRAR